MSKENMDAADGVPMPSIFATTNAEDEAEAALVAVLEDRRGLLHTDGRSDSQRDVLPAVPPHAADLLIGESSPKGHPWVRSVASASSGDPEARRQLLLATRENISTKHLGIGGSVPAEDAAGGKVSGLGRRRFSALVSRVRQMAKEGGQETEQPDVSDQGISTSGDISTTEESAASTLLGVNVAPSAPTEAAADAGGFGHRRGESDADALFTNVLAVEDHLFQIPESLEEEEEEEESVELVKTSNDEEAYPPGETSPLVTASKSPLKKDGLWARLRGCCGSSTQRRQENPMAAVLGPKVIFGHILNFLRTTFIFAMVPLLLGAGVLYYYCGNPELDFLPFQESLSWWLIFVVRQLVTLQLACCTEYLAVDALAFRSKYAIKIFGPLLTLFAMQANGWPFILSSWGVWDLILLHGDGTFALNWLYFLDIAMFSDKNSAGDFLNNETYLRILLAAILTGMAVSVKKTYLALFMGRRTFDHFKEPLEKIMVNIILLAEIADLAAETESPEFAKAMAETEVQVQRMRQQTRGGKWKDIQFQQRKPQELDDESSAAESMGSAGNGEGTSEKGEAKEGTQKERESMQRNEDSIKRDDSEDGPPTSPRRNLLPRNLSDTSAGPPPRMPSFYRRQSSSGIKVKDLLDRWEEPENKADKEKAPSIYDMLQFRKALAYLDDEAPFSESFGPSATRAQCIRSSQKVYKRLMNFAPEALVLPFDVILSIAMDDNGDYDKEISEKVERLFRPDKDNELTLLAFVQSCDYVYKKVRYLRASVANSTLIDRVLEQNFNILFYFALLVVVLTVLDFKVWTLLVSFSTLAVSFAFAVGPSAARAIEGILLIAMRRPYDLGDRISLTSAEFVGQPDTSISWFVEDVSLFSTTLRFAPTNEVSTVNNGSIANSRIVNFARSQNALVNLTLLFKLESTGEQMDLFRSALDRYIKDNPRCWVGVVMFRINNINPDMEFVEYKVRIQHVKAWQEMASVLVNQGEILKFCIDLSTKLGIVYDEPSRTMTVQFAKHKGETGAVDLDEALRRFQTAQKSWQSEEK